MANYRPKLPGATNTNALDFRAPEGFWPVVEEHTGPLSGKQRNEILHIIDSYYSWLQFEWNASNVGDAANRLGAIQKATASLIDATQHRRDTDSSIEASHHIDYLLNLTLETEVGTNIYHGPTRFDDDEVMTVTVQPGGQGLVGKYPDQVQDMVPVALVEQRLRPLSISEIFHMLGALQWACSKAARTLDDYREKKFYKPGKTWNRFVANLAGFWVRLGVGFAATAAKHYNPDARPSPFAAFVAALQSQFPERFRDHAHSTGALSV